MTTVSIITLCLAVLLAVIAICVGILVWMGRDRKEQQRIDLFESDWFGDSFARDPEQAIREFHEEPFQ